jgi:hypothetical protein
MNRLPDESLIDFTFRFLNSHGIGKRFQQVNEPVRRIEQRESVPVPEPVTGGPQPVVDLLDSSQDVAVEYSRPQPPQHIEHLPHICKVAGCTYPRVRIDHKRSANFCARHLGIGPLVADEILTSQGSGSGPGELSDSQSDRSAELIKGSLARVSQSKLQGQEITGLDSQRKGSENSPAPESRSLLCTMLDLHCEVAVDDNQYGILTCKRDAVGICKHCGLPVCLNCVKWECCCMAVRHEVIVQ